MGCLVAGILYYNNDVITHELNQKIYVEQENIHENSNTVIKWEKGLSHNFQKKPYHLIKIMNLHIMIFLQYLV